MQRPRPCPFACPSERMRQYSGRNPAKGRVVAAWLTTHETSGKARSQTPFRNAHRAPDDVVCARDHEPPGPSRTTTGRRPARPRARAKRMRASLAAGSGVAGVTAAIVFVIGQQLFPVKQKQPPAAPCGAAVAETPPPAPKPPPMRPRGAGRAARRRGGRRRGEDARRGSGRRKPPRPASRNREGGQGREDRGAREAAGDEAAAGADTKPIDKQRQADKDLAREAWRRNRPTSASTAARPR